MTEARWDIAFVKGTRCEPFEYLCSDCGQLRLSFVLSDSCGHCGSDNIIKGKLGTLSKELDNGMEGQNEGMGRG